MKIPTRHWLWGIAFGAFVIVIDSWARLDFSVTSDDVSVEQTDAPELETISYPTINDENLRKSFSWLFSEQASREKERREKAENQKQSKSDGNDQNNQEDNVASTPVPIDERFQLRGDDLILTLKGTFFASTYFAVVEISDSRGRVKKTKQLTSGASIDRYEVEAIDFKSVTLVDTKTNEKHTLVLFK